MSFLSLESLPEPITTEALTKDRAQSGAPVEPLLLIRIMDAGEWERFTLEWASSLKTDYQFVDQRGGSGDQGRDVVARVTAAPDSVWDNYQCKHYAHALTPSDVWLGIGKVCYYAYIEEYHLPRYCYFVAPRYVGPRLAKLFDKPQELKQGLFDAWESACKKEITRTKEVELDAALRAFIDGVDFAMFRALPPQSMIEQHRRTPWYAYRFGGGLAQRATPPPPPSEIGQNESRYVRALLDAYEDRLKRSIGKVDDITERALLDHFHRSRREFFSAESLREFSRDNVPNGTFEALLEDVYSGVIDIVQKAHPDAYERVLAAVAQAKAMTISSNALELRMTAWDKGGICHQLANEERITWLT